jgi:hypothetical protein
VPGDPYYLPRRVVKETFDKKPTRPSTVFIFKWYVLTGKMIFFSDIIFVIKKKAAIFTRTKKH